jgi:hypothetical protein
MTALIDKTNSLTILDRMAQIVKTGRTTRGHYLSDPIHEDDDPMPKNLHGVCGGREFCAVGSLWIAADIHPEADGYGDIILPGVNQEERHDYAQKVPGLKLALDALNQASEDFRAVLDSEGLYDPSEAGHFYDAIEALFEGTDEHDLTPQDLITVINQAKYLIQTGAVFSTEA